MKCCIMHLLVCVGLSTAEIHTPPQRLGQTVNALLVAQDSASPAMTHRMQLNCAGGGVNDDRALPPVTKAESVFHCYATSRSLASC